MPGPSSPCQLAIQRGDLAGGMRRGFGSLRVRATIGTSTWTTSIFPGKDGYVLPVKRPVRVAEALDVGDTATVTVELIDFVRKDDKARQTVRAVLTFPQMSWSL